MNLLMRAALSGSVFSITPDQLATIPMRFNANKVGFWNPFLRREEIPEMVVSDPALLQILQLPFGHKTSEFIWSGLMKLKTLLINEDKDLSSREIDEIINRINTPFQGSSDYVSEIQPLFKKLCEAFLGHMVKEHPDLLDMKDIYEILPAIPYTTKSYFAVGSSVGRSRTKQRLSPSLMDLSIPLRHPLIRGLFEINPQEFVIRTLIGSNCVVNNVDDLKSSPMLGPDHPLGSINAIHELGLKERVVYVPTPTLQCLTYAVYRICNQLCTYWWPIQGVSSHSKAQEYLAGKVAKGRYMFHSMDYSSFTDRFPYRGIQDTLLSTMVEKGLITPLQKSAVDVLCSSKAKAFGRIISYLCGTPMGSYPSFSCGSLSHGLVLTMNYLNSHPGLSIDDLKWRLLPFVVTGDDSVIFDEPTYQETLRTMSSERLDVPLQREKVLTSPYVVNFCSHIITVNGIFEQKKLKAIFNDSVSDAKSKYLYYGPSILDYYEPNVKQTVLSLPDVLEPHGFKKNTLSTMYERARDLLERIERETPFIQYGLTHKEFRVLSDRLEFLPRLNVSKIPRNDSRASEFISSSVYRALIQELDLIRDWIMDAARPADYDQLDQAMRKMRYIYQQLTVQASTYGLTLKDLQEPGFSIPRKKIELSNADYVKRISLETEPDDIEHSLQGGMS